MGRISKALTASERWRSLAYQGVDYLFAPEGSPLRELIKSAKVVPPAQSGTISKTHPAQQSASSQSGTARPVGPAGPTGPGGLAGPAISPASPAAQNHSPRTSEHSKPVTSNFEPSTPALEKVSVQAVQAAPGAAPKSGASGFAGPDWPELWRSFAAKVQAGRPLLWTYPEAGLDLAGQGEKSRSELIRNIIAGLKLPAGSSNFWPHRSTPQAAGEDEIEYFRQGLAALNPKFILAFGADTLAQISPETAFKKYAYFSFEGRLLLMLPAMPELASVEELDACLDFLSTFAKPLQRGGRDG